MTFYRHSWDYESGYLDQRYDGQGYWTPVREYDFGGNGFQGTGYERSDYGRTGYERSGYENPGYGRFGYERNDYERTGYGGTGYQRSGQGGTWGSGRAGWQDQPPQYAEYDHSRYGQSAYHNISFEQQQARQDFRYSQYGQERGPRSSYWNQQQSSYFPPLYPSSQEEEQAIRSHYFQGYQPYAPFRLQTQPHQEYSPYQPVQPLPMLTQQLRTDDDVPPPPPPPPPPISSPPKSRHQRPPPADAPFERFNANSRPPPSVAQQGESVSPKLDANATTFVPQSSPNKTSSKKERRPKLFLLRRPKPTKFYMKQANETPVKLASGRPLLIVLDLNGTLISRKVGSTSYIPRPKVSEFLDYLFSNHHVFIWSSAKSHNVQAMCEKLLSETQQEALVALWARDKLRIPAPLFDRNIQVYKQLSWIWNDNEIKKANPNPSEPWNQRNTVLIDDSAEKAVSEPHNAITLEEFEGREDQMETDVLGQVINYLEALRFERNVSASIRAKPFEVDSGESFNYAEALDRLQVQDAGNEEPSRV